MLGRLGKVRVVDCLDEIVDRLRDTLPLVRATDDTSQSIEICVAESAMIVYGDLRGSGTIGAITVPGYWLTSMANVKAG